MKKILTKLPSCTIARRLIRRVMFFALAAIVLCTFIIGTATWLDETKKIETKFDDIQKSYLDVIQRTLWVNDTENLQVILMGICRLPGIEYADIHSKNDFICKAGEQVSQHKLTRVVPIIQTYNGNTYPLGKLHLAG